jgi:hypothetical protein
MPSLSDVSTPAFKPALLEIRDAADDLLGARHWNRGDIDVSRWRYDGRVKMPHHQNNVMDNANDFNLLILRSHTRFQLRAPCMPNNVMFL